MKIHYQIIATLYNGPAGQYYQILPDWGNKVHTLDGQVNYAKYERERYDAGKNVGIHYNTHRVILALYKTGHKYMRRAQLLEGTLPGDKEQNKEQRKALVKHFKESYESLGYVNMGTKDARIRLGVKEVVIYSVNHLIKLL